MPYCRKCGAAQCDDFVFCTECGVRRVEPIKERTAISEDNGVLTVDDEATLKNEKINVYNNLKAQEIAKPPVVTVDYPVQKSTEDNADAERDRTARYIRKTICILLVGLTFFVQFLPFYRVDTLFYEFEASLFEFAEKALETLPSSSDTSETFTVLLIFAVLSIIMLACALIYFIGSDGVAMLIGTLVFSGSVHAYLPMKIISTTENSEGLFTDFMPFYFILLVAAIVALVWHNAMNKADR